MRTHLVVISIPHRDPFYKSFGPERQMSDGEKVAEKERCRHVMVK